MVSSCYVHVPFCDTLCSYCDFCRYIHQIDTKNQWLQKIGSEINKTSIEYLDTLYFGGGTPTCLSYEQLDVLTDLFTEHIQEKTEWTVEANPESFTEDKMILLKEKGVNRISLGVQSFKEELLNEIGRKHTVSQIDQVIHGLRKHEFHNISIDLMYGLPGQSLQDVYCDLQTFLTYDLEHLSIYSLQIEPNSVFGKKKLQPCDEDLEADMYEMIEDVLVKAGYIHYETSSYAKKGFFSQHNLAYWQDKDFYGIGCGASGKINNIRFDNTRILDTYLDKGASPEYIIMNNDERAFEAIMMGLRTSLGFSYVNWDKRYKMDFLNKYKNVLNKWVPDSLYIAEGWIRPTRHGMEILNSILVDFLSVE